MRYSKITYPDINNGSGCRVSIFFQGCSIRCKNCFNSELWDFSGGKLFDNRVLEKLFELLSKPYISGLSILGGEPTDSPNELILLCKKVKEKFPNKTIWLYSGRNYNTIKTLYPEILENVDILVDGIFIEELKDSSLAFRGSSNQRILQIHPFKDLSSYYDKSI